jgi:hypothetical protein
MSKTGVVALSARAGARVMYAPAAARAIAAVRIYPIRLMGVSSMVNWHERGNISTVT